MLAHPLHPQRPMARRQLSFWRLDRANTPSSLATLTDHAQAFGRDVAGRRGWSVILVSRDSTGLHVHAAVPADGAAQSIRALADGVGARPVQVDGFPSLDPTVIAVERAVGNIPAGRDRQEAETNIISERLAATLDEVGSWVAVTFRRASNGEIRKERMWYQHFYGSGTTSTHHAMSAGAVVMSVYAGGPSKTGATSTLSQAAGVLPGFDLATSPQIVSRLRPAAVCAAFWVAVVAATWALGVAIETHRAWTAALAGAPFALLAAGFAAGILPTRAARLEHLVRSGDPLPPPPHRRLPAISPREATPVKKGRAGSYPLHREAFLVGAHLPALFASPHFGAASGARQMVDKEPPPELVERCGPRIGLSAGLPVHLALDDTPGGRVFIGAPSSGKSILVRLLWGYDILERRSPSGLPGSVGASNTMVAFESKGEGALAYMRWATELGETPLLIDLGNPTTAAIDLFAGPQRVVDRAALFVNAMRYGFGEASIQDRSTAVLQAIFTAALVITPDMAAAARVQFGSPIWFAHVLVGAHGDEAARSLYAVVEQAAMNAERDKALPSRTSDNPFDDVESQRGELLANPLTDVGAAASRLGKFFSMSPSARANEFAAARNKIDQLVEADSWFQPGRQRVGWDELLVNHRVVVVNTGSPTPGPGTEQVGQKLTETMGAMLLFTLREAIARNCAGWFDTGRAVSIYADELSQVAATGPEVVEWLREQARQRGVRLTMATQRPEQLNDRLRACVLGFSTVGWMKTTNPQVIRFAADDLSIADDDWSPATVAAIPNFHVAVRSGRSGQRLSPALVKVDYFEDDRFAEFPAAQGR
jgi:hypothetical protein